MTRLLHAAIVGTGKIAGCLAEDGSPIATHTQALIANADYELVAAMDNDREKAVRFCDRWRIPNAVVDLTDLSGLDVVSVCSPDYTHASTMKALLGLPSPPRLIVMEKPLCTSAEELAELTGLAASVPMTAIAVNHSRRFDARYDLVKQMIATAELGRLVSVRWDYYGGWMHNGPHLIDMLRMVLDAELVIERVAIGWQDRPGDIGLDVDLTCPHHARAPIEIRSFPEQAFQLFEGEIRLEQGRLRFLDFGSEIWIDEVRVNIAQERELKHTTRLAASHHSTPMETLYTLAARYLRQGDREILTRAGLDQACACQILLFKAHSQTPHSPPRVWPPF